MPRIVHLGKFYPPAPGGIETHLRTLALSQERLGASVRIICVNHADKKGRDITFNGWKCTPSVTENDGPVPLLRVGRIASIARFDVCLELPGALRRELRDADVIHLHTPNPTMLIALALANPRAPLVVTHHSDVVRQRWLRHAVTPFERIVYSRAAKILATSPLYQAGSAALNRYGDKVVPLPMGIDLEPLLEPSAVAAEHTIRFQSEYGQPMWLMVGRLIYYKGIEVALQALRHVRGRLLIIGGGPLEHPMRSLASSLGVADRVVWRGHASPDELVGAYHAATALWFPSTARSEGYGLVQVEAMASGCPVINTAIPNSGVSWVSPHEQTGLTVAMNNPDELAMAARRLSDEAGLRARLGRQGRERAIACFSQERMARESLEIYRALKA